MAMLKEPVIKAYLEEIFPNYTITLKLDNSELSERHLRALCRPYDSLSKMAKLGDCTSTSTGLGDGLIFLAVDKGAGTVTYVEEASHIRHLARVFAFDAGGF